MTPIKDMKTVEMVAEYNQITGKSIKKFSTRADGERMLKAARAANTMIRTLIVPKAQHKAEKKQIREQTLKEKKAATIERNKAKIIAERAAREAAKAKTEAAVKPPKVLAPLFKRPKEDQERTVRSAISELIMAGKKNKEILELVRKEFGVDKVPSSYPAWYRCHLRRIGVISY